MLQAARQRAFAAIVAANVATMRAPEWTEPQGQRPGQGPKQVGDAVSVSSVGASHCEAHPEVPRKGDAIGCKRGRGKTYLCKTLRGHRSSGTAERCSAR